MMPRSTTSARSKPRRRLRDTRQQAPVHRRHGEGSQRTNNGAYKGALVGAASTRGQPLVELTPAEHGHLTHGQATMVEVQTFSIAQIETSEAVRPELKVSSIDQSDQNGTG